MLLQDYRTDARRRGNFWSFGHDCLQWRKITDHRGLELSLIIHNLLQDLPRIMCANAQDNVCLLGKGTMELPYT